MCQEVFEIFCFGKSIGEVKLGKWENHLEIWEKEKLEVPMPMLFFFNNLSWGQIWENLNEACNWDESRMTGFGSSRSVQQKGVGKVLINRNEQKWKCCSWLTFKNCDPRFFTPDSQWWGVWGARFSTKQMEQCPGCSSTPKAGTNQSLKGESGRLSHWVRMYQTYQYVRAGIKLHTLHGDQRLSHILHVFRLQILLFMSENALHLFISAFAEKQFLSSPSFWGMWCDRQVLES